MRRSPTYRHQNVGLSSLRSSRSRSNRQEKGAGSVRLTASWRQTSSMYYGLLPCGLQRRGHVRRSQPKLIIVIAVKAGRASKQAKASSHSVSISIPTCASRGQSTPILPISYPRRLCPLNKPRPLRLSRANRLPAHHARASYSSFPSN